MNPYLTKFNAEAYEAIGDAEEIAAEHVCTPNAVECVVCHGDGTGYDEWPAALDSPADRIGREASR